MKFTECEKALKTLIEGETNAVATYTLYAATAEKENLPIVAKLFKALAKAETIHIENHNRALGYEYRPTPTPNKVGTTELNLREAIDGETHEAKTLYPTLIKKIKHETNEKAGKVAKLSMVWASKAEKVHAEHLKKAFNSVKNGDDFTAKKVLVCRVCGNVEIDPTDESECDVCGHDFLFFDREA